MDSDLLKVGAQCSLPSCDLVDFLPIVCPECNKFFCSSHVSLELHKCPALLESRPISGDLKPLRRCDFEGCKKPSLRVGNGPETCFACQRSFCVDHRHPDNHNCPSLAADTVIKSSKAKVSSSVSRPKFQTRVRRPPTDPVKLAQWQKMELMKMRHQAVPGDPKDKTSSPPLEQRLHVKLLVDENQTEKVFWLRKTVMTGRALDLLVSQLNLTFDGNPALSLNKIIASDTEALVPLRNDQLLADQIEDGATLVVSPAMEVSSRED